MQDNANQYKTLGSVGGMGSSASAGGFSAGPQIAGKGGARNDSSPQMAGTPKAGGNVLVGGHFGPSTAAAPAGSFAQGDAFAASKESGFGPGPVGGAKAGGNLMSDALDSQGNPKASQGANGYNQGDMFAGKAK